MPFMCLPQQNILLCVCFSKTSHVSALVKHPLIRQLPEKHHMAQPSLQRNQKCPLQMWRQKQADLCERRKKAMPFKLRWRSDTPLAATRSRGWH
jgi:stalled ribosome alternative rescue factor ArfA